MIEFRLAFYLVFRIKLLGIHTKRDVDDGLGTVFSEESGIFPGDGGNAVNSLQSVEFKFL